MTVASFNERAIHLYQKFGFRETLAFHREEVEFIVMVRTGTDVKHLLKLEDF